MRGILVVTLVASAALAPAAGAAAQKKHAHLRLSLVPLQTAQLGRAGASLPLEFGSGTVANRNAPPTLKRAGRVSGYLLDYGNELAGGAGVTSIETQIEQFRTPAGAKKGLKFWKTTDTGDAALYHQLGVALSAHFFKTRHVGSSHFAYVTWMQVPNADALYTVDEEASSGRFLVHASVAAGTESTAEKLAPFLMAKLVHRLGQLLGGRLHGKPAKLPTLPAPGPPSGGPDLSTLVVGPSDFAGQATVIDQGYASDPVAVSTYEIGVRPAGPFDAVSQVIIWYANANEATWEGTLFADIFGLAAEGGGSSVDLSAVGDNAHGVIVTGVDQSGASISEAVVSMWKGQAVDYAFVENAATIQPSDVQTLAQAMASHLNAGLGG